MKKNTFFDATRWASALALALTFGLLLTVCSKKTEVQVSGNASPESDFETEPTKDSKGVVITGYVGAGGAVTIPATIKGKPVREIAKYAFRGQIANGYYPANDITEIVVPASVATIGDQAFEAIDALTKVTLPDSLKDIPDACFDTCSKLTTVNLPKSLKTIGDHAFYYCGELNNLVIPAGLSSVKIDDNAFRGCGKLPNETRQKLKDLNYRGEF